MVRCYCGLGGNLGPVREVFDQAIADLRARPDVNVVAVSSVHHTAAVGTSDEAGGDYFNAAVGLETNLPPLALLDLLQSIELKYGRTRELRWGPRTLDLDLLFYGDELIESPRLLVPHPGCWFRRFVLDPLVEIAPDLKHPVKNATIRELRNRLLPRPLPVALCGANEPQRHELISLMQLEFPQAEFSTWPATTTSQHASDPALLIWLGTGDNQSQSDEAEFSQLPTLPRLAAMPPHPGFLRYVLRAALGT